jgi:MFS family permease
MIFWLAGSLGQMFSGFLQSAAYNNLSGVHGLSGWRWLFVIDAIITLPIAIAGFFFLPGSPLQDKKSWWLTEAVREFLQPGASSLLTRWQEHQLARERLERVGRKGATPWSWRKIRGILLSWHTYFLRTCLDHPRVNPTLILAALLYVIWNNGYPQNPIGYWLKSFNPTATSPGPVPGTTFTVSQINTRRSTHSLSMVLYAEPASAPAWNGRLRCRRDNLRVAL